jgi:beta-glucosidase
MDLPGHTDKLISAVADVNPNVVVVLQSGTPVAMPWAYKVSTLVQAWYGGNESGNAIADVLFGDINPSGKLPLSFPFRNEDNPAYLNYRSERGRVLYGEDIYIGYRFYEATNKRVQFPFGHGLSYTSFKLSHLKVSVSDPSSDSKSCIGNSNGCGKGSRLHVTLRVENTGPVDGTEVIQIYVAQHSPSIKRPPKELKGFAKSFIRAGEIEYVEVCLELKYATSFWDEAREGWISERGTYDVLVGNSSANTPLKESFDILKTEWWNGL